MSLFFSASAKKNPCFKCSNWDATGQGFVESGENCITYLECWKDLGSNRIRKPLARFCPIGSMVINEDAVNGAPCGKCDVTVCPECMRDYSTIEISEYVNVETNPVNTKHLYNICTTSAQRLRRWSNVVQMLYKCFAGMSS